MKKLLNKLKATIGEYGIMIFGISLIVLCLWGTGLGIICVLTGFFAWVLGFGFRWGDGVPVWIFLALLLHIHRKKYRERDKGEDDI